MPPEVTHEEAIPTQQFCSRGRFEVTGMTLTDNQIARLSDEIVRTTGDKRWSTFSVAPIEGGRSNLTYALSSDAGELILRRPPTGNLLPSAHDVIREVRVQRALSASAVPVPKIILADEAGVFIGAPAYVMERVQGAVIREELPGGASDSVEWRRALSHELVETLAKLHSTSPRSVGLEDFGRPRGYVERQIRRWENQWSRLDGPVVPEMATLLDRLKTEMVESAQFSILHGDYRLDNCVISDGEPPMISAVLDWEMATLGDPLMDVGMFLFYWREPDDFDLEIVSTVTQLSGFPRRGDLISLYEELVGTHVENLSFYLAFAHFKFAVIARDVAVRSARTRDTRFPSGDPVELVTRCAQGGLDALKS